MATKNAASANQAQTAAPGGAHSPAFPPFNKETFASQIVWFAITFVALYLILSRLALPRIGGIFEARKKSIEGDLAQAERLKSDSDAAIASYEKALAEARNRAQTLANETRDKLAAEAEAARKTLEERLNGKLADAEKSIAATKTAAMANVKGVATEAASAIVSRLIGTAPAANVVESAVDQALKR